MICNSDDRKSINSSGLELSPFFFSILKHVCEFEISDTNRFDFFVWPATYSQSVRAALKRCQSGLKNDVKMTSLGRRRNNNISEATDFLALISPTSGGGVLRSATSELGLVLISSTSRMRRATCGRRARGVGGVGGVAGASLGVTGGIASCHHPLPPLWWPASWNPSTLWVAFQQSQPSR